MLSSNLKPYRGIRPYRYRDEVIFYGRRKDVKRVIDNIILYRGSILMGESGAGKSSLVNAGILPNLVELGFRPDIIRIQPIENQEIIINRITEYLDKNENKKYLNSNFIKPHGILERKVISSEDLFQTIEELSKNEQLNQWSLDDINNDGRPVLIFDQFEEIITLFSDAKSESIQQNIIKTISKLLNSEMPVKILLSFRQDYYVKIKTLLADCYGLKDHLVTIGSLSRSMIYKIIRGPFEDERLTGRWKNQIDEQLAQVLVGEIENRESERINLSEIQILCKEIWSSDNPQEYYDKNGITGIIDKFLNNSLDKLKGDGREVAEFILMNLVTDNYRDFQNEKRLKEITDKEKIPWKKVEDTLKVLEVKTGLIQSELRNDIKIFELSSEFLVSGIAQIKEVYAAQKVGRRKDRNLIWITVTLILLFIGVGFFTQWFQRMEKEVEVRKRVLTQHQEKISKLENENLNLMGEIDTLESRLKTLKKDDSELQKDFKKLATINIALKAKNKRTVTAFQELQTVNNALGEDINSLIRDKNQLLISYQGLENRKKLVDRELAGMRTQYEDLDNKFIVSKTNEELLKINLKEKETSLTNSRQQVNRLTGSLIQSEQVTDSLIETSSLFQKIVFDTIHVNQSDILRLAKIKVYYKSDSILNFATNIVKMLNESNVNPELGIPAYEITQNEIVYYNETQIIFCQEARRLLELNGFGTFKVRKSSGNNPKTPHFKIYVVTNTNQ